MSFDIDAYETHKMLETIAGDRCPCEHHARSHKPAEPEIPGSRLGACMVIGCPCKGLISLVDDDLEQEAREHEETAAREAREY